MSNNLPAVVAAIVGTLSVAAKNFIADLVIEGVSFSLEWLREWIKNLGKKGRK